MTYRRSDLEITVWNCIQSYNFWYFTACLSLSLFTSLSRTFGSGEMQFLAAFLLFDYFRMPAGIAILQSVRVGGMGLLNSFRCGMVLIIAWGSLSFLIFQKEIEVNNACDTAFQCISKGFDAGLHGDYAGLHGSDFDDLLDPYPLRAEDNIKFIAQWGFVTFFFLVWEYILLGIVQGQIVDAFSEIRSEEDDKKKDTSKFCLICCNDRHTLEVLGGGFDKHINDEHNPWDYLYFLVRIDEMSEFAIDTAMHFNLTGMHLYVKEQLEERRAEYIPKRMCLALPTEQEENAEEAGPEAPPANSSNAALEAKLLSIEEELKGRFKENEKRTRAMEAQLEEVLQAQQRLGALFEASLAESGSVVPR